MILSCDCGAKLKIDDAKIPERGAKVRCPRCGTILAAQHPAPPVVPIAPPAPRPSAQQPAAPVQRREAPSSPVVLVAHENEAVRTMVRTILSEQGFDVESAVDGVETLKKATALGPHLLLLDVGLPGIYGFELCERLKGDPQTGSIKIMLITSVYDVSRYKRAPVNLYGADDYIEKHEISDYLAFKVRRLLYPEEYQERPAPEPAAAAPEVEPAARQTPAPAEAPLFSPASLMDHEPGQTATASPAPRARGEDAELSRSWPGDSLQRNQDGTELMPESFSLDASVFEAGQGGMPSVNEADPEAIEKARRFARIIVSDIALYNQGAVREGIQNGTFYELLKEDVEEGRQLYEARVPASIRTKKDFYQEAFDNFIEAQKKIVR